MAENLNHCTCGKDNLFIANPITAIYQVHCAECGNYGPITYSKEDAIKEWNKKVAEK